MALTLASLIRGPASVTWNGLQYISQGDITVRMEIETFDIVTSTTGVVDTRDSERVVEISFTPSGEWEDGEFQALFPGASTIAGTSWYGSAASTANDLVIQPINNSNPNYTFHNAQITRIPQLILSTTKTMLGAVTFRAINSNDGTSNLAWSNAASLFTISTGTYDGEFDPTSVKTQPYVATWTGITGFTAFHTQDGWTLDFDLQLDPVNTDAYGVLDMTFRSLTVTARCMPIGPSEANITTALAIQGTGAIRGRSRLSTAAALAISPLIAADTAGSAVVTIPKANLVSYGGLFGTSALRHGEAVWKSMRSFTSGDADALFTLASPI